MQRFTICVLSLFVTSAVWANVKMPVVNIAAGGISARSAFGEEIITRHEKPKQNITKTRKKTVVARTAQQTPRTQTNSQTDLIAKSKTNDDVLSPKRPRADLWAKNTQSLRIPHPSEFSVIRNDAILPEESLDTELKKQEIAIASTKPQNTVKDFARETDEINTQIARLVEMQKRAEKNLDTNYAQKTIINAFEPKQTEENKIADIKKANEPVSLRRMVVPSSDDVIVRKVEKIKSPRIARVRNDMTKMTPAELRNAFRKTFLSENKHLSTYSIDSAFDTVSDMTSSVEGFTAQRDLSEIGGVRPLEIKIKFRNNDSALSRDNYKLLTEYAGIVVNKPTRAIQVAIPQYMTKTKDERKLAARRLAIVEQVLNDNGVSQQRIVPVLSNRNESGFVLRIISSEQYETLTQQQHNIFGDNIGKKTYKSMTW